MMHGSWGKVLKVNLSTRKTEDLRIDEQDYKDFIGGSGLAAKWFFDNRGFEKPPLSPKSPFIVMNGPLSGTNLPGASRLEICARSPLTGIWGESSMGGHFSPQLKRTGYDGVIVVGAAKKPVYIHVTDEGATIRNASHLWGKDTYETEKLLKEEAGDKRAQVISIGPAGENLVKFACVMNDRGSAAGRCGMGAVMGSKKLKAIVAHGKQKPRLSNETAFKNARSKALQLIKHSLVAEGLKNFGSNVHMEYGMAIGDVPTKNWRMAYWPEGPEKLGGTAVAGTILTRTHSCFACPISCKRIVKVDGGPFAMEEGPGSEYEAAASLGTLLAMDDREANNKANELCNRFGMDVISAGATIAYATEAFEKGLIKESDTGGIELAWNRPRALLELLEKTALRDGIGDDLAEGARSMSEKYGGAELAPHVKGLEVPMHDPRALWAMALTYATSIRGACHCADSNLYVELGLLDLADLDVKRTWPFKSNGKAAQTVAAQKKGVIANSAVICEYVWNAMGGKLAEMAELLGATTGHGYTTAELARTGDRIWLLKRSLGNLMGAGREDDLLPRRILEPHLEGVTSSLHLAVYPQFLSLGPVQKLQMDRVTETLSSLLSSYVYPYMDRILSALHHLPVFAGRRDKLSKDDPSERKRMTVAFDEMLEEFYALREIDANGRPSRRVLEALGLHEVAQELHEEKAPRAAV